jgi:hypothetical protein
MGNDLEGNAMMKSDTSMGSFPLISFAFFPQE